MPNVGTAEVELAAVEAASVSAAPSPPEGVTVVEPLAIITLVTVDCWAARVLPSTDEPGIVVRKVEVIGLAAVPLLDAEVVMLGVLLVEVIVPFAAVDVDACPAADDEVEDKLVLLEPAAPVSVLSQVKLPT